jgi:hypothetical protein
MKNHERKGHAVRRTLAAGALLLAAGSAAAGEVTLFSQRNFQGEAVTIRGPAPNLERIGFNDAASSLVVRDGVWQVCTGARFNGSCVELNPGEYSRVGIGLDDRISSLREVRPSAVIETVPVPVPEAPIVISPRGVPSEVPIYAPNARVVLYQYSNFRGRSLVIDRPEVPRLTAAYFDDGAASLRVEGGAWMFCSDAGYSGRCRTFGPGDYASLPWELDHVASGRFVPDRYSYLR